VVAAYDSSVCVMHFTAVCVLLCVAAQSGLTLGFACCKRILSCAVEFFEYRIKLSRVQGRQCRHNITQRRVRVTIVAAEKQ
jgi:hypothetical protein